MPTEQELLMNHEGRIATVEERTALIPEMREDLKVVRAYVDQQKGRASLASMLWTSVVALGAAAIGTVWGSTWHK